LKRRANVDRLFVALRAVCVFVVNEWWITAGALLGLRSHPGLAPRASYLY